MIHKFKTMIDGSRHNTQRRLWLNNGAISVLNSLGSSICLSVCATKQSDERTTNHWPRVDYEPNGEQWISWKYSNGYEYFNLNFRIDTDDVIVSVH